MYPGTQPHGPPSFISPQSRARIAVALPWLIPPNKIRFRVTILVSWWIISMIAEILSRRRHFVSFLHLKDFQLTICGTTTVKLARPDGGKWKYSKLACLREQWCFWNAQIPAFLRLEIPIPLMGIRLEAHVWAPRSRSRGLFRETGGFIIATMQDIMV